MKTIWSILLVVSLSIFGAALSSCSDNKDIPLIGSGGNGGDGGGGGSGDIAGGGDSTGSGSEGGGDAGGGGGGTSEEGEEGDAGDEGSGGDEDAMPAEKSWRDVQTYSANGNIVQTPNISMNRRGDAVISWSSLNTTSDAWIMRYSSSDRSFAPAEKIGEGARSVRASISDNGNIVAAWARYERSNKFLATRIYSAIGSEWFPAENIYTTDLIDLELSQVAMDHSGNAFAVWATVDMTFKRNIYVKRYNSSVSAWDATVITLAENLANAPYPPQIAVNLAGDAVIVWSQATGLWARKYVASGDTWQSSTPFSYSVTGSPAVAMDDAGNIIVVWNQPAEHSKIVVKIFDNATARPEWTPLQVISDVDKSSYTPKIAMTLSGDAIVAWIQQDTFPFGQGIKYKRYAVNSRSWTGIQDILPSSPTYLPSYEITADPAGNAFALWISSDNMSECVAMLEEECTIQNKFSQFTATDSMWSSAQEMAGQTELGYFSVMALRPHIKMDVSGNAMAVWNEPHTNRIFIRKFE